MTDDLIKKLKLGATGGFPKGKLEPSDEGGLRFAIGNDGKIVRLVFGVPVTWIGLPPQEARDLANMLLKHADQCKGNANP